MKSDFMIAITQLAAEKKLPKEVILKAVEAALLSAFKKECFAPEQEISVRISPQTGDVRVLLNKIVAEKVANPNCEISPRDAKKIRDNAQIGETVEIEATPQNAGRIAAQTAKQVVLQRLREAERDAIFEEYKVKSNDIISGTVQSVEPKQIIVDLGRAEGILPVSEQVPTERYRVGQRIKVYLADVIRTSRGTELIVSRSHKNLLQRLLELEVPEIRNNTVEVKAVAREAGFRSKVAVAAKQDSLDPVGCCIGPRGLRIQNIVNELNGEKIDVIQWHPDPAIFIAKSLSPAQVQNVHIDPQRKVATVIVPDRQLSLAIGKEGQNARLAAKLTGWRIDIKSASMLKAEQPVKEEAPVAAAVAAAKAKEAPPAEAIAEVRVPVAAGAEKAAPAAVGAEPVAAVVEPEEAEEGEEAEQEVLVEEVARPGGEPVGATLRFAEDIGISGVSRAKDRPKKAKKAKKKKFEDGVSRGAPAKQKKTRVAVPGAVEEEDAPI